MRPGDTTTMAIITERQAGEGKSSALIPDKEEVILTIIDAKIEEDKYADPEPDGTLPEKLVITWELQDEDLTRKQKKAGMKGGKRIWQRLGLFYYVRDNGLPTMFKDVIDSLEGYENEEGIAFAFDSATFEENVEDLVGIKAPCLVEQYAKKMGANKGQIDNRIIKVKPLEGDEEDEDDEPAPRASARPAPPARRNVPQTVESEEVPF
jgi:hypothetical protein